MVAILQPRCLHASKAEGRRHDSKHEPAERENVQSLSTLRGLENTANLFAFSSRRGGFSHDSPLYRTR
jgi:hypothetical protein